MTLAHSSFWPSLLAAGVLHAAAAAWLVARPPPRLQVKRPPTTVRLATRPRPLPPEAVAPATPPPLVASRPTAPSPRTRPPETLAPPQAAPPPPGAPPPRPRRFAVSIDALTTSAGGLAMPTTGGATAARGDPSAPVAATVGDNVPFASRAVDITDVEEGPRLLRQPTALDLRRYYPEEARKEGIEANVRVELLVDETGAVGEVRVVEGSGPGFDAAVQQLGKLLSFSPARRGGRAIAVRYLWTFKFRLDG